MGEQWRRIGLIVNPAAGSGVDSALQSARRGVNSLEAEEVLTGAGQTGSEALTGWQGRIVAHDCGAASGREQTRALARWLSGENVDAIVVVGGDGTLADVAQVFIEAGCRTPVLGVGAGSTNVGRLMTCRADEAAKLNPDELETWDVDCLAAAVNGQLLGLGFNDVVLGCTIVGTINGQLRDLDAAERMNGKVTPGTPSPVGTAKTKVIRCSGSNETVVAGGTSVGTVVAGFAEPAFFGKAVTGGICLAALTGLPAGCLISSLPLVQVEISASSLLEAAPIVSSYVTLSEEVSVAAKNVSDGTVLCVDGNPLRRLNEADRVVISVRKGAVRGVRFRKDSRSK